MPAGRSDGSITLDTSLDNTGFEKGSKELLSAVRTLTDEIQQMGKALQSILSAPPSVNMEPSKKAVSSFDKEVQHLAKTIEEAAALSETAFDGTGQTTAAFEEKVRDARGELAWLRDYVQQLGEQTFVNPEYAEVTKQIESAEAALNRLYERRDKMEALGVSESSQSWKGLEYDIRNAEDQLRRFEATRDKLDQSGQATTQGFDTAEYQAATQVLDQFEQRLNVLVRTGQSLGEILSFGLNGAFNGLKALPGLAAQAAVSLAQIGGKPVLAALSAAAAGLKKILITMGQLARKALSSAFSRLSDGLHGIGKSAQNANGALSIGFKKILKYGLGIRSMYFLFRKIRAAITEGFQEIAKYNASFNTAMSSFKTSLEALKNSLAAAFAPLVEAIMPTVVAVIDAVTSAFNKLGMLIASLTGNSTFMQATKVQQNYAASADNTATNSNKAAKAINKEAKAADKAKKTLAGFDDVQILNDNDKSSALDKGTTTPGAGAGFTSTPITSAMSDLAKALKDMWDKADFTQLGSKIGTKLKEALEQIPWEKIKATLSKIAKSIATFLNGFLEVPSLFDTIGRTLAEGVNSAFTFVDSFVHNFHWKSLGAAVKDLILGVVNNLDWGTIRSAVTGLASGVGAAIQTAFNNRDVWSGIFSTIAKGFNTLVAGLGSFLTLVNWGDLGTNIANGLNDAVDTIEWETWRDTLISLIQGAFDGWYNFITTFHFEDFGTQIGTSVAEAITGIDWEKGTASIAETINGLFKAFIGFVDGVNGGSDGSGWKSIGSTIVQAVQSFFSTLSWEDIGSALSRAANALLQALSGAVTGIDWDEAPQKIVDAIGEFFDGFEWDKIADSAFTLLGNAFAALVQVGGWVLQKIKGVFEDFMDGGLSGIIIALKDIGDWIKKHVWDPMMKGFADVINIRSLIDIGMDIFNGVKQGITDAVMGIGSWIYFNIFKPLVDGIKSIFGISSPATSMMTFGSYIIQGLLDGIIGFLGDAVTWVTDHIFTPIVTAITSVFGIVGDTASALFEFGSAIISGFISGMEEIANTIGDWVNTHIIEPIQSAFEWIQNAWDEFWGSDDGFEMPAMEEMTAITDNCTDSLLALHGAMSDTEAWKTLKGAVTQLKDEGKISEETYNRLQATIFDLSTNGTTTFAGAAETIAWYLAQDGLAAEDLNTALGLTPGAVENAAASMSEMGDSAAKAEEKTSGAGTALDTLNGLNVGTAIKMAIISGAVDSVASSGKYADDEISNLKQALEEYQTNPTEKGMQKIAEAFDAAGVSAEDFDKALMLSLQNADDTMKREMMSAIMTMQKAGTDLKTEGKTGGENVGLGLQEGMKSKKRDVNTESSKLVKDDVLKAMDTAADSHSPSRETFKRGAYLGEGLINGLESTSQSVLHSATEIISSALSAIDDYQYQFVDAGFRLMQGLDQGLNNAGYYVTTTARNLASGIADSFYWVNWGIIGQNIAVGLNNGIVNRWNTVMNTARNLANSIANTVRRALDIHSPSGVFEDLGTMTVAGLVEGIEGAEDSATRAVGAMTDAIIQEAETSSPLMRIGTMMDGLDTVLTSFADRVSWSFQALIESLENIANGSSFYMPAAAAGAVVPYAARRAAMQDDGDKMATAMSMMAGMGSQRLTRDDLVDVFTDLFRRYMNFDFYIGNEQVARASNAGNERIQRRYKTSGG